MSTEPSFPLTQTGFETATFAQGFYPSSFFQGTTKITTDFAHSGSQSFFLGQDVGGDATARLTLPLDLTGQSDVLLDFWVRSTGAGEYRRVYISDNSGANWTEILNLDGVSIRFSHIVIDLAQVAATNGLALNDEFRIRFSYSDYRNGDAGDGMVLDDIRLTQRAEAIASFPLTQTGFETATFAQGFYPSSFSQGTAELTTDFAHSGSQSLFLGQNIGGDATARLTLPLDLTGQTDVFLDFWVRSTGAGEYRRVYISDNSGASWTEILNLNDVSQSFQRVSIDVVEVATANGLALNDEFRIRFSYSDYRNGDAGDGMVIDDLSITSTPDTSTVYLPAIQR